jgi:hypothetical protein
MHMTWRVRQANCLARVRAQASVALTREFAQESARLLVGRPSAPWAARTSILTCAAGQSKLCGLSPFGPQNLHLGPENLHFSAILMTKL